MPWPPKDSTTAWKICHSIVSGVMPLLGSMTIEGRENVPKTGGVVLSCNHPGGVDVVALGYASPRQIFYMAKQELFEFQPWFSALITSVGAFPIRRGENDTAAIEHSIQLVRDGKVLGMFPEGTRNKGGPLGRPKSGAVRIAALTGAPLVPSAVIGIPALHKEWKNPLRRTPVTVRFGEPIHYTGDPEDGAAIQRQSVELMYAIARLLPPEMRGRYGEE
ncbi:MAG: 1-acyl-sn-glycerol-3-phosphate acyltransferase [Caldilineaceae bacterium]|nr:1-acyl-sn-glycerol-3-phosphate acyltransferase [Caldilineaceae bacterium]